MLGANEAKRNRRCLKNEQNVCLGFTRLDPCQARWKSESETEEH